MPPLPLSAPLARVTVQALDRKAAQLAAILTHWDAIAGSRVAGFSFPVKLSRRAKSDEGAILTLASPSAWMTELQHESPLLLKRVNAFFGHCAVKHIRIVSRSAAAPKSPPVPPPLSAEASARLLQAVADIADDRLRDALQRLGAALQQG